VTSLAEVTLYADKTGSILLQRSHYSANCMPSVKSVGKHGTYSNFSGRELSCSTLLTRLLGDGCGGWWEKHSDKTAESGGAQGSGTSRWRRRVRSSQV